MFNYIKYFIFHKLYDSYFKCEKIKVISKKDIKYLIYPLTKKEFDIFMKDRTKYLNLDANIIKAKVSENYKIILLLEKDIKLNDLIQNYIRLFTSSDYIVCVENNKFKIYNTINNLSIGVNKNIIPTKNRKLNLRKGKVLYFLSKPDFSKLS